MQETEETEQNAKPPETVMTNEETDAKELHDRLHKASKDLPAMREMLEASVARLERTIKTAEEAKSKARVKEPELELGGAVATPGVGGKTSSRHAIATKYVRPSSPYLKQ